MGATGTQSGLMLMVGQRWVQRAPSRALTVGARTGLPFGVRFEVVFSNPKRWGFSNPAQHWATPPGLASLARGSMVNQSRLY